MTHWWAQRRLRRVFKDLTSDEKEEIEERGSSIIDAIEQKVTAERQEQQEASPADETSETHDGDDELSAADDLSDDEKNKGAVIGRVEVRVAGQMRRIPYKIIMDPDNPEARVIAQRDSDTGELEPVVRRQ